MTIISSNHWRNLKQFTSGKGSGEKFGIITADQVQKEEEEEDVEDAAKFS